MRWQSPSRLANFWYNCSDYGESLYVKLAEGHILVRMNGEILNPADFEEKRVYDSSVVEILSVHLFPITPETMNLPEEELPGFGLFQIREMEDKSIGILYHKEDVESIVPTQMRFVVLDLLSDSEKVALSDKQIIIVYISEPRAMMLKDIQEKIKANEPFVVKKEPEPPKDELREIIKKGLEKMAEDGNENDGTEVLTEDEPKEVEEIEPEEVDEVDEVEPEVEFVPPEPIPVEPKEPSILRQIGGAIGLTTTLRDVMPDDKLRMLEGGAGLLFIDGEVVEDIYTEDFLGKKAKVINRKIFLANEEDVFVEHNVMILENAVGG